MRYRLFCPCFAYSIIRCRIFRWQQCLLRLSWAWSDEELAQIRSAFKGVSFAQAALSAMAGEDGYEDEKLKAFALVFERLRGAVADTPIHELLYMMLDETGFYRYASAMPAGKRRRQNIDMLIEMAAAYEKTSYKGLFHFVRYIDIQQKYEIDYGEADTAGENDDVVRIMDNP